MKNVYPLLFLFSVSITLQAEFKPAFDKKVSLNQKITFKPADVNL